MIYEVLQIVTDEVNNYLFSQGLTRSVKMENIAFMDGESDAAQEMQDSVVLTLINLSEEPTLKNFPNTRTEASKVMYQHNKINLNLYLLFSSNRNTYAKSLKDISKIIEFFQGKHLFNQSNSNYDRNNIAMSAISEFRFTMELYTPTFEELNYIWGTLGGKQLLSALYKLSMIQIDRSQVSGAVSVMADSGLNPTQFEQP